MFKTEVEIVTGFLGSGKTTFINALLKNTLSTGEKVLIVQYETGETQIINLKLEASKLIVKQLEASKIPSAAYLRQMLEFYKPHRVIIEHNGTKLLEEILNVFSDGFFLTSCREPIIYHTLEAGVFEIYYHNMKELLEPYLVYSNLIVLNNCSNILMEEKNSVLKKLQDLNPAAIILTNENLSELEELLKRSDAFDNGITKRLLIGMKNRQLKKGRRK